MSLSYFVHWLQIHSVIFTSLVFILVLITTYLPSLKASHQRHGAIPLSDDH